MVSVAALSVIYHCFMPRFGQTKDYTIRICCFSAKHAALKALNQNNVSEWSNMCIC